MRAPLPAPALTHFHVHTRTRTRTRACIFPGPGKASAPDARRAAGVSEEAIQSTKSSHTLSAFWTSTTKAIDEYVLGEHCPPDSQPLVIATKMFINKLHPPYTALTDFKGKVVRCSQEQLFDLLAFPNGVFWERVFSIIKEAKRCRDAAGVAGGGSSGGSSGGGSSGSSGGK